MENSPFDSFELQLTTAAQGFLREAGKWATFLAILGFIGLGFMVLAGLAMFALGSTFSSASAGMGRMGAFPIPMMGLVYLIIGILYFFPIYYLYKFASNAKNAVATNNSEALTSSLSYLKSHYKFLGIFTIVIIATYIIGIIVAISVFAGTTATSGF